MKHPIPVTCRTLAAFAILAPTLLFALPGAAVADGDGEPTENFFGDVRVTNTETVQVYTDASGKVQEQRVYEQIALTGEGAVTVVNPVSTDGLRNLDGFGGFDVEGDNQVFTTTVDGEERLRSVSAYEGDLPLTLDITYLLDGEEVEPGDVVGESGQLEVRFHVENVTGEEQEIQVPNGTGGTVTRTADVVVPLVGSLTTSTPPNFTDVRSDQANMAGDGRGGTRLSFTMTLFPPIGAASTDFGYTANITDGVIPDASISALPVNPLEVPSVAAGAESYQAGAETGEELTADAIAIDTDLLRLRDGASTLAAGLVRLYMGADTLSAGLNGVAVPGADQLAGGAQQLADDAGQLAAGTQRLDHGTERVYEGVSELSDGAVGLDGGVSHIVDGADQVADVVGQLGDAADRVADGADRVADGAGRLSDDAARLSARLTAAENSAPALLDGLRQVRQGLRLVDQGLAKLRNQVGVGAADLQEDVDRLQGRISTQFLPLIAGMRTDVTDQLQPGIAQLESGHQCQSLLLDYLLSGDALAPGPCVPEGLPDIGALPVLDPLDPLFEASNVRLQVIADLQETVDADGPLTLATTQLRTGIDGLLGDLDRLACGLDNTTFGDCATAPGLLQGIGQLDGEIERFVGRVAGAIGDADDLPAAQTLRGRVNGLQDRTGGLIGGGVDLLEGLDQLSDEAVRLSDRTGDLATGARSLADGAGQLADGAGDLADGLGMLEDGADQLAGRTDRLSDGAGRLLDGVAELADRTQRLDDGAGQVVDGSIRLRDGAGQLGDGFQVAPYGSSPIRDGLQEATAGAAGLVEGADRLSEEGTKRLIEAGSQATLTFGEKYALIVAAGERAKTESMAFGAPEGADGITAYTFQIHGEDGTGSRNWTRGLTALAVFGAGVGVMLLRRRSIL